MDRGWLEEWQYLRKSIPRFGIQKLFTMLHKRFFLGCLVSVSLVGWRLLEPVIFVLCMQAWHDDDDGGLYVAPFFYDAISFTLRPQRALKHKHDKKIEREIITSDCVSLYKKYLWLLEIKKRLQLDLTAPVIWLSLETAVWVALCVVSYASTYYVFLEGGWLWRWCIAWAKKSVCVCHTNRSCHSSWKPQWEKKIHWRTNNTKSLVTELLKREATTAAADVLPHTTTTDTHTLTENLQKLDFNAKSRKRSIITATARCCGVYITVGSLS